MVNYAISGTDWNPVAPLKLLAAGVDLPLSALDSYQIEAPAIADTAGLIREVERLRPDLLLLDAAFVDEQLAKFLTGPVHSGMPVVLRVPDEDADRAGLLLGSPLSFVAADADAGGVRAAVNQAAGELRHFAADSSSLFEGHDRIATLKRDAERVAAALADLIASRPAEATRAVDAARIRAHIKARRLRERFLPVDILADPAWDMLLDLSAARLEDRPVSVSSLCIAANVPTTTALRWIKNLCDTGLFERSADPADARRAFVGLSPAAARTMDACLDAVLNHPGQ